MLWPPRYLEDFSFRLLSRLQRVTCPLNNLSRNVFGLTMTQWLHKVELGSTPWNDCMDNFETIVNCSSKLQRETCLLQLVMDFFSNVVRQVARKIASCNTTLLCAVVASPKKLRDKLQRGYVTPCNLPANCFDTHMRDKVQEKLHHVTPAYSAQSLQGQKSCEISCKEGMLRAAIRMQLVSIRTWETRCKKNCIV